MYKRKKIFFRLDKDYPCSYLSPFTMENEGYVVLYNLLEIVNLIFLSFIILKTFLCFLVFLIISKWVSRDASGWTDTKIKQRKLFFYL